MSIYCSEVLGIHTKNLKLAEDVDLEAVAKETQFLLFNNNLKI
jgi:ATP-dependent 26S proteasome regulatory subunit